MVLKDVRWIYWSVAVIALAVAAVLVWRYYPAGDDLPGIVSGNGRIEAVEVDIASKVAGRLEQLLVDEGQFVRRGEPLARIDTAALDAAVRQAQAQMQQAVSTVATAHSQASNGAANSAPPEGQCSSAVPRQTSS